MFRKGNDNDIPKIKRILATATNERLSVFGDFNDINKASFYFTLMDKSKIAGFLGVYRYSDHVCYIDIYSDPYFTLCSDVVLIFKEIFRKFKFILAVTKYESYGKTVIKFFERFNGEFFNLGNDILCSLNINQFKEALHEK